MLYWVALFTYSKLSRIYACSDSSPAASIVFDLEIQYRKYEAKGMNYPKIRASGVRTLKRRDYKVFFSPENINVHKERLFRTYISRWRFSIFLS
jgi:hypothetical protein